MFFKLSVSNMRRSMKDYAVYFLTLTLAVCIFYMFNSIEAQQSMLDISQAHGAIFASLSSVMFVVSFFVVAVLAFLIIYANKFMIKRRKKEFGIYMTLGMPQKRISGILVFETLLIGLLALAVGLVLGLLASQGLAVVSAKLFDVNIVNYHFIFSQDALNKTLLGFGLIFLVVMLFNARTIYKLKLIDLLTDEKKNEELKVRKKTTTMICFVLGVLLTAVSYYFVISGGVANIIVTLGPGLLLNTVGTLLLFASISSFLLTITQKNKRKYFKGLNMFTMRQMNSKVNSNFVSMTFICEMLFLTIVILSTVTGFNSALNQSTQRFAPYDVSYTLHTSENPNQKTLGELLPELGMDENTLFSSHYEYNIYGTDLVVKDITTVRSDGALSAEAVENAGNKPIEAIRLSDFNAIMKLQNQPAMELGEGEFGIVSTQPDMVKEGLEEFSNNAHPINLNGKQLTFKAENIRTEGLWTSLSGDNYLMLIVPDQVVEGMPIGLDVYVANYAGDPVQTENLIYEKMQDMDAYSNQTGTTIRYETKDAVRVSNSSVNTMLIFIGIYLGLIFLIAAAAVLALQQLSEASDSKHRFDLLRKLGTDERMISKALFSQVGTYFLLPLLLALVHSVAGMYVMNKGINTLGGVDVLSSAGLTAIFMAIVYGGYFLATYFGCKSIIHGKMERVG